VRALDERLRELVRELADEVREVEWLFDAHGSGPCTKRAERVLLEHARSQARFEAAGGGRANMKLSLPPPPPSHSSRFNSS
jgi:hypothetical protein